MSFRFTDFLEMAAPIGVSLIPGIGIPAAIALSAAMKGGVSAAKGGSATEVLRDTALGAAGGAAGAGTAGLISKFAGKAAGTAADVGGKAAEKAFATAPEVGFGKASETAMKALSKAGTAQKLATGVSEAFAPALGEDPAKTAALLKTFKSGGRVVGAADQAAQMLTQPPRFSQQHTALAGQHPGMNPKYQFGQQGFGQPGGGLSLGFGGFY